MTTALCFVFRLQMMTAVFISFIFAYFFFLLSCLGVSAGGHGQSSEQNTRKSVSVNVGGIKCMVESQYISNHDFLEVIINYYFLAFPLVVTVCYAIA